MLFSFLHPLKLKLQDANEHPLIAIHEPLRNTNEGSEFLDDALRMEDLILTPTEECIAAGSPYGLL